jgi:hypothetical protein
MVTAVLLYRFVPVQMMRDTVVIAETRKQSVLQNRHT